MYHQRRSSRSRWRYRNVLLAVLLAFCCLQVRHQLHDQWALHAPSSAPAAAAPANHPHPPWLPPGGRACQAGKCIARKIGLSLEHHPLQVFVMLTYYISITASKVRAAAAANGSLDFCLVLPRALQLPLRAFHVHHLFGNICRTARGSMQQLPVAAVMQRAACAAAASRHWRQQAPVAPARQSASADRPVGSLSAARSRRSSCWWVLFVGSVSSSAAAPGHDPAVHAPW